MRDTPHRVTIVGLGPRGLGVLERLVSLVGREDGPRRLEIHLVDPTCTGAGVHAVDQPDYLLMHCPGTDLTIFPDRASLPDEPDRPGPTFYEWAAQQDVRVADRPGAAPSRAVRPTDFLPRSSFGRYLSWFLDDLLAGLDERVSVVQHRDVAVDARIADDGRPVVICRSRATVTSDHLFLTIGYGQEPGSPDLPGGSIPFPLPPRAAAVEPGASVSVSGFGLTALDLVSSLTVGRGGAFRMRGEVLDYVPSGREPDIVLHSRSGVPARARPHRVGVRLGHAPVLLTDATVERLCSRGPRTVDFETEVLPLIQAEMLVAYWRTFADGAFRAQVENAAGAVASGRLEPLTDVLDALGARWGQLDVHSLFSGTAGMRLTDHAAYEQWVLDQLVADLEAAAAYPHGSPVKAALEIVEDTFDTIRAIVGGGNLTLLSQGHFNAVYGPQLRRIAVGPIADRQTELVALMRSGVVRAPLGPAPVVEPVGAGARLVSSGLDRPHSEQVAAALAGHLEPMPPDGSGPDLLVNLYARGLLRPYRGGAGAVHGAVDVDRRHHPVNADGIAEERIWVLGPICEGVSFYTHVLPEPGNRSDCVVDAHAAVSELLESTLARS